MHELSIAQSIMDIVIREAEKVNARKVLGVSLKIGELTGVVHDSLTFCFEVLSKSTIAEHAHITIESVPTKGHCPQCKCDFAITDNHYRCNTCGNTHIDLISGRELQINHLDIDDETD